MKQIIFIFSILFALTSCESDDSQTKEVTFSTILQNDSFYGNYDNPKANLVIRNQEDWTALISKMNPYSDTNYYVPDATIDFTKYQVIAVFDEVRNYGGYSIDITKITQTNNRIFVKIEQLKTGGLNAVITQPCHIVKIAKINKEVVFQ
ncbi:protease complex subunit PrcB family protein [Flavobacterium sp. MDT1-60]|uniref:protease complex subunit PrcB family protein n=1 Tax=Flavobacterium sp. MDT1-60 TaxID=1979344 RepID=UPI00178222C5|nr:protease complex subunit PrcB family protein [Flavobacterium sp. MDT1-60]QOG03275.1 protease complex subunit PrcB family protein [Flavobacterium sp. MDT1-60]